jgi:hypothetical protein
VRKGKDVEKKKKKKKKARLIPAASRKDDAQTVPDPKQGISIEVDYK